MVFQWIALLRTAILLHGEGPMLRDESFWVLWDCQCIQPRLAPVLWAWLIDRFPIRDP